MTEEAKDNSGPDMPENRGILYPRDIKVTGEAVRQTFGEAVLNMIFGILESWFSGF